MPATGLRLAGDLPLGLLHVRMCAARDCPSGWLACNAYLGKRDAWLRGGTASNEIGQQQDSQDSHKSHGPAKLALAILYGC